MQDNINGVDWIRTARDIGVSALSLFMQGALFALGGLAVAKIASQSATPLLSEAGNVVPLKRTGT